MADVNVGRVYDGKFKLVKLIAKGTFGVVYSGINLKNNEHVAVKLESKTTEKPQLLAKEARMYEVLQEGYGIPCLKWFGADERYIAMVIEHLGPSLKDMFNYCNRKFTLKTVLALGYQMIDRIQYMHSKGFLHRDIRPESFLMGKGPMKDKVYIIDYGLGKKYMDLQTHKHIRYRENKNFHGTPRYASVGTHLGIEQSRRDDLESLGYVLMYFLRGSLPWQGLRADTKRSKYVAILHQKMRTGIEGLCESYPTEFLDYFRHCQSLKFQDEPDYSYLKKLFGHLFIRQGYGRGNIYDWTLKNSGIALASSSRRQSRPKQEAARPRPN